LKSATGRRSFGVGRNGAENFSSPRGKGTIVADAAVEASSGQKDIVSKIAELDTNTATLAVHDLGGTGFRFGSGSPCRRIISPRSPAARCIRHFGWLAAAALDAPSDPARLGCQGVDGRHDLPLVRIDRWAAATSEAADRTPSLAITLFEMWRVAPIA